MAKILVTHGAHFVRSRDGHVFADDNVADYAFWQHYLSAFEEVGVAARVRSVDEVRGHMRRADGQRVVFHDLPDYLGPWQYLRRRAELVRRLANYMDGHDAFCLRVSCPVGTLAWRELQRRGRPFAVEVVGDPWDFLGPGSVRSITRPLARRLAARALRAQCRTAAAAAYVTRDMLQKRYPPHPDAVSTFYSSIDLPPEALREHPVEPTPNGNRMVFVGSLSFLQKGPDVLIDALAQLGRPDVRLMMIGDGRARPQLEARARALGVLGQITFRGVLPPGAAVREALDDADLFVLPSRHEGLPRAMIEAMARGLACIGTTVGGIPELLPSEDTVPPGNVQALARKVAEFLDDPKRRQTAGRRNLERAHAYRRDRLTARRTAFYTELRRINCPET